MNKGKILTPFYKTDFVYKEEFLRMFHIAGLTLDKKVSSGGITCETDRHGRKWYYVKDGDTMGLSRRRPPANIKPKKKSKDIVSPPTEATEHVASLAHKEIKILSTRLNRLTAENKTLTLQVEYLRKSLSIWKEVG